MRGASLLAVVAAGSISACCVRSSLLGGGAQGLAFAVPAGAVLVASTSLVEMPPVYIDAREQYARRIEKAAADAVALCARQRQCPAVHVRRADLYVRTDGSTWTVVRLCACGEERVYERARGRWADATWRLR